MSPHLASRNTDLYTTISVSLATVTVWMSRVIFLAVFVKDAESLQNSNLGDDTGALFFTLAFPSFDQHDLNL